MKRHESLVPLSRQHHDALVLAQRLIVGRSTAPRSPWPTDRRRQVDLLISFFEAKLAPHFVAEEAHLFPVAVEYVPDVAVLVSCLLREHDDMRTQVGDLRRDSTACLDERLPMFGECLRRHIRAEERVLFERLQQEMTPAQLNDVGVRLSDFYASGSGSTGATCS